MEDNGRPAYTEDQYQKWLDDISPFLKIGSSLYYAIEKAGLSTHKDSIYRKYRLNDWFCEKIDAYKRYPGELVNSIFTRSILSIDEKLKQGLSVNREEWHVLRFFAEKHRSCQPFFVTRFETAQVEPDKIIQILDDLNRQADTQLVQTDYAEAAENARKYLEEKQINEESTP